MRECHVHRCSLHLYKGGLRATLSSLLLRLFVLLVFNRRSMCYLPTTSDGNASAFVAPVLETNEDIKPGCMHLLGIIPEHWASIRQGIHGFVHWEPAEANMTFCCEPEWNPTMHLATAISESSICT